MKNKQEQIETIDYATRPFFVVFTNNRIHSKNELKEELRPFISMND